MADILSMVLTHIQEEDVENNSGVQWINCQKTYAPNAETVFSLLFKLFSKPRSKKLVRYPYLYVSLSL